MVTHNGDSLTCVKEQVFTTPHNCRQAKRTNVGTEVVRYNIDDNAETKIHMGPNFLFQTNNEQHKSNNLHK